MVLHELDERRDGLGTEVTAALGEGVRLVDEQHATDRAMTTS